MPSQNRRTPRSSPRMSSPHALARTPSPMYSSREQRSDLSYIHGAKNSSHLGQTSTSSGATRSGSLEVPAIGFVNAQQEHPGRDGARSSSRSPTPNLFLNRDPYPRSDRPSTKGTRSTRTTLGRGPYLSYNNPLSVHPANHHGSSAESGGSSSDDDLEDANPQNSSTGVADTMTAPGLSGMRQYAHAAGGGHGQRKDRRTALSSTAQNSPSRLPVLTQSLAHPAQAHSPEYMHPEPSMVSQPKHISGVKPGTSDSPRYTGISQPISKDTASMGLPLTRKRGQRGHGPEMDKPDALSRSWGKNEPSSFETAQIRVQRRRHINRSAKARFLGFNSDDAQRTLSKRARACICLKESLTSRHCTPFVSYGNTEDSFAEELFTPQTRCTFAALAQTTLQIYFWGWVIVTHF